MIMGAGKTTCIGPLLALMLADGKSLVTQVVPNALLTMSRNVMWGRFCNVVVKPVFTLTFDRSWPSLASVYQGMYNAVTRQVEQELLPCLRQLGIKFYVYNPLAGGLLTGKHKSDSQPQVGRFKGNKLYSDRFWKQSFFEAAEVLTASCEEHALTPVDAALRWLKCHSFLQDGDAVIIGASSISQVFSRTYLRGHSFCCPLSK